MKQAIILDPGHGIDTPGKRSPDGTHREYLWSRARISKIIKNIYSRECANFDLLSPFVTQETEPGLTARVKKYNEVAKDYEKVFVLSLHNDAYGNNWSSPRGISVWTSRGETKSDNYATSLYQHLKAMYPNDKFRPAMWLSENEKVKDPDWESNFTILAGNSKVKPNYDAVLLEWRFQTNKQDVELLKNPIHNEYFEDMITNWILNEFNK